MVVLYIITIPLVILLLSISDKRFYYLANPIAVIFLLVTFFYNIGINTFSDFYFSFMQNPLSIVAASYLPHGIIEISAFILSGAFVLIFRDCFKQTVIKNSQNNDLKILLKNLFFELIPIFLLIVLMILLAAMIESQITPIIVKNAFESYLFST